MGNVVYVRARTFNTLHQGKSFATKDKASVKKLYLQSNIYFHNVMYLWEKKQNKDSIQQDQVLSYRRL